MFGEALCFHCGKTTIFEKVTLTSYYPLSLYGCGYCTECGKLRCNATIVNVRLDKEPSDDPDRYYLKIGWSIPYWERHKYEKGNCYKSSTTP